MSLRPAWSTELVPGQPRLRRKIHVSKKEGKRKEERKESVGITYALGDT